MRTFGLADRQTCNLVLTLPVNWLANFSSVTFLLLDIYFNMQSGNKSVQKRTLDGLDQLA